MNKTLLLKKPLLLVFLFWFPSFCFAQVTEAWVNRYNGPASENDEANDIAVDAAGNVYVTGAGTGSGTGLDYVTVKYDANGTELWVRRYNGTGNATDIALAITVDASGNVYVTGRSNGSGTGDDYLTIRYDTDGNELWTARYNGPGNEADAAQDIAVDGDGNVYVTGRSTGIGTSGDYATVKYNADGEELWVARLNGRSNLGDGAQAIAIDASGNVYVTGSAFFSNVPDEVGSYYATVKYNADGEELWVETYSDDGGSDIAYDIKVDASGNVYVTGEAGLEEGYSIYATVKYNTNGEQQWAARHFFPSQALALDVDAVGNVYVTGRSVRNGSGFDYATIKYDASGNELWVAWYNGHGNGRDEARDIEVDAEGNVYVTGLSFGSEATIEDYATVKYNTNGVQQWVQRYNGLASGVDEATALTLDTAGNVYVTGRSTGSGTGFDYATIKYVQEQQNCGHNDDKVLVCHKGNTLCIGAEAAAAHLKHGDEPGACSDNAKDAKGQLGLSHHPNPVTSSARIQYELPFTGTVAIKLYDRLGKEVATLEQGTRKAGVYSIGVNVSDLRSGVYYYRITLSSEKNVLSQTGKMSVVK